MNNIPEVTDYDLKKIREIESAVSNEIRLILQQEGVKPACILSALAMIITDIITVHEGFGGAAPWFEKQADMFRQLERDRQLN